MSGRQNSNSLFILSTLNICTIARSEDSLFNSLLQRCILDIDVQGARSVRASSLEAIFIFICPPSFNELEKRLRSRYVRRFENVFQCSYTVIQCPSYIGGLKMSICVLSCFM